jgi:hypothetical protein
MDLDETPTHSYIVRVWIEETALETGRTVWRGHITHVPGGERGHFRELDGIAEFVAPWLEGMGVKLGCRWRVKRWLTRWRK